MIKTCIVIRLTMFISIHDNLLNMYIQFKVHGWRKLKYVITILANLINTYNKLNLRFLYIYINIDSRKLVT